MRHTKAGREKSVAYQNHRGPASFSASAKAYKTAPEQATPAPLEELLRYAERQAASDTHIANCEWNAKTHPAAAPVHCPLPA